MGRLLTYKEKNGLFMHLKYKMIIFCRTFGIYKKFLLLAANTQSLMQQQNNQQYFFFKLHILYFLFAWSFKFVLEMVAWQKTQNKMYSNSIFRIKKAKYLLDVVTVEDINMVQFKVSECPWRRTCIAIFFSWYIYI